MPRVVAIAALSARYPARRYAAPLDRYQFRSRTEPIHLHALRRSMLTQRKPKRCLAHQLDISVAAHRLSCQFISIVPPLRFFGFRIAEDLAIAFDQITAQRGGRAALLRALVEQAIETSNHPPATARVRAPVDELGLFVHLYGEDLARLDEECRAAGTTRRRWLISCVRSRLGGTPQLNEVDRARIASATQELRDIKASLLRYSKALSNSPDNLELIEKHYKLISHLKAELSSALETIKDSISELNTRHLDGKAGPSD